MHLQQELLALAIEMARSAGAILLDGRENGFGKVDTKSSSVDVVTETDKASERFIVETLAVRRPDDGMLGEEGTFFPGTTGVKWVVDPLDGTVNFTYGLPLFAVSIAVEINGEREVGVVYNPMLDEMFTAVKGEGAFLNGRSISVNHETDLSTSLVATGFSYLRERRQSEATTIVPVIPSVRDIRRSGSAAIDLCWVACGRLDGYFERSVHPWDVAAGDVIATEAGARVSGLNEEVSTSDVCAANPQLHPQLLQLISL